MNILALFGSPRPEGNTWAALDMVLTAAREAGAETETIHLRDLKNASGCIECNTCKGIPDEPACALKDDVQDVLAKSLEADLVVWAMPVFCWSPPWLVKIVMDRFYCMFKYTSDGQVNSLVKGRKVAAVITAGGGADDGADLITETCRRLAGFAQCEWLGSFVVADAKKPEAIRADADLAQRAQAFGRKLAG